MKDNKPMPKPSPKVPGGKTPFEKINEVTRRVMQVPKTIVKPKKALRKHR